MDANDLGLDENLNQIGFTEKDHPIGTLAHRCFRDEETGIVVDRFLTAGFNMGSGRPEKVPAYIVIVEGPQNTYHIVEGTNNLVSVIEKERLAQRCNEVTAHPALS